MCVVDGRYEVQEGAADAPQEWACCQWVKKNPWWLAQFLKESCVWRFRRRSFTNKLPSFGPDEGLLDVSTQSDPKYCGIRIGWPIS